MVPLEQDEYIIKEVRRHWFFIAIHIFSSTLITLVPVMAVVVLNAIPNENTHVLGIYALVLTPLWILFVWIGFFYFWTDYYLDVLVITNKRILDINQNSLFNREVSTFPLENIQDITMDVDGILATLLHFGDVKVQTAGQNNGFDINDAANPEEVKQALSDAHDKALERLRNKVL